MSQSSGDTKEWEVLSSASTDESSDESVSVPDSPIKSFEVLSAPVWVLRRWNSVPANLNYGLEAESDSNEGSPSRTTSPAESETPSETESTGEPVDFSVPRECEQAWDSEHTTSEEYTDDTNLTSIPYPDYLSESEETVPPFQIKSAPDVNTVLHEIIETVVSVRSPASMQQIFLVVNNPDVFKSMEAVARISYLQWFAFFCNFWPIAMERYRCNFWALPASLLQQYGRFFKSTEELCPSRYPMMKQLLKPRLQKILDFDPYNRYVYQLLCFTYRAVFLFA
ncbi:hypothetical protein EGR_09265 [Echinococcus granulosus]|uniref:Uncharacterized protein n=1 Tax=Echinococcus granulosus TaxID=6210 RepID=W6UBQ0_ECHGR|nr:hypothetical protein EGR_09265 [Echinococcus granulosus]EUB55862.1 hypothetical protein EGR_09265 [Echinococcus granulosus]